MRSAQQQLLELYDSLDTGSQSSLLAFAEFLASRNSEAAPKTETVPASVPEPEDIERPEDESIVAALKRLARTYPMLDKSEMLSATSDMVATHVMQGTDASQVIDQLENVFAEHYRQLKARSRG